MAYEKKDGSVTLWPQKSDPENKCIGKDLIIDGKNYLVFGTKKIINTKDGRKVPIVEINITPDRNSAGNTVPTKPSSDLPF